MTGDLDEKAEKEQGCDGLVQGAHYTIKDTSIAVTEAGHTNDNLHPRVSKEAYDQDTESAIGVTDAVEIDPEARLAAFKNIFHEVACLTILTMAPVLGSLNSGALMIALPKIGVAFNVTGGTLSWTMSATSLATGAFLLLAGQLADTLGRRRQVLISYLLFAVLSLGAGFTKQFVGFAVLRALQGVAGATAVTAAVGILGAAYAPGRRRNAAMATFAAGAPVGFVIGIISGGICSEILSWESVLYFCAIFYGVLAVAGYFILPVTEQSMTGRRLIAQLLKIDYVGAVLTICGFALFVFSLSQWEAAPKGWKTPYIIACLIVGVLLIVALCFYEAYVAANPLMPMHIWRAPGFALCMATIICGWMCFTGVVSFYATLYFQNIRDVSPILTTAYFLPMAIGGILVNIFAGFVLHKIAGRILLIVAMLAFTGSALCWSFVGMDTLYWALPFPGLVLSVVGADLAYNVCNLHALSTVDKSLQSTAAGVFNTCLQLGTAVGLAAGTSVVASVVPNQITASKHELLHGYRAGFWFALGVAGLGLFLSLFLKIGTQGGEQKEEE